MKLLLAMNVPYIVYAKVFNSRTKYTFYAIGQVVLITIVQNSAEI